MIYPVTPLRVEAKLERQRALRAAGLTLAQMEILQCWRGALTSKQRQIWMYVVKPIGQDLYEHFYHEEEDGDDDYV